MTILDFIPGTMCDERLWSKLLPHLDLDITANFISLSEVENRETIRLKLEKNTGQASNLVAFSMGGYLALEHTLAHPGRVRSLVVIAASAKGLNEMEKGRRRRILEQLQEQPYAGLSRVQISRLVHSSNINEPSIVDVIRDMDRTLGKETLIAQLAATMDRPDRVASLPEIRCPVLIVGALDDELVEVAHLKEMRNAITGSELRLLIGSGHMIPLESPQVLAREISAFLRGLD
jgi:pimeloyl-ACP methyl ester carboxylesterase